MLDASVAYNKTCLHGTHTFLLKVLWSTTKKSVTKESLTTATGTYSGAFETVLVHGYIIGSHCFHCIYRLTTNVTFGTTSNLFHILVIFLAVLYAVDLFGWIFPPLGCNNAVQTLMTYVLHLFTYCN